MAANDKFNLSAHSPDGPGYTNGHRGPYSVPSFERSGSFRDASGNGIPSSFLSMSKSVCAPSHSEGTNILKSIISHLKPVVLDQKFPRPGEMNRAVSSIVGISSAQSLPKTRPLTSASVEEIRSLKNNLHENSIKARDRVKAFNEATTKIEKHCRNISKKRSRIASTSNDQSAPALQGGSIPRANSQGLQCTSGSGPGPHKLDERTKTTLLNRKLQTSLAEMDARPTGISKTSGPPDRGRDVSEFGLVLSEERTQEPLLAVEGWDRTKKKRSAMKSDVSASTVLATQPKFLGEAKPRVNNNGSRHKSQQDACSATPTSNPKMSAPARGPRSSLATFPKVSGSPQQTLRGSDERDSRNFVRQNSFSGTIDRKRSVSARSPSPPVAHWSGQRSQKIRGARRSNCSPIVSDHHEVPSSDTMNNAISNEENSGVGRCLTSSASRQVKPKVDDILSSGLSESEDSAVANYKSQNKIKKHDTQGTIGQTVQRVGALLLSSKNRKVAAEGDANVGIPRSRIEQGIIAARPSIGASNEKPGDLGTSFQLRKSKVRSERSESKPGRSPLKNSERKGHTRPQHSVTEATLDFPGEPVDDTEALLSAATAVVDAKKACSGTFWKQIQPFFNFLSSAHITFLSEQIRLVDESAPNSHAMGGDDQKTKGDLEYISLPSTPASSINECDRDVGLAWQMEHVDPFLDQLVQGIGSQGGVSICQILLSAIIEEEDFDNLDYSNLTDDPVLHDCQGGFYDPKLEAKTTSSSVRTPSALRVDDGHFSNGFMPSSVWPCPSQLLHQKLGSNGVNLDAETLYTDYGYSQMGTNDRIVLELRQLGLYPDPMPELAPNEDENISTSINCLQEKLHGQVLKKKKHILLNLEKVVLEERVTEQRELERFALDRLVWMTYEKYMVGIRPNSSSSKSSSKHTRLAALSCAKQTLARCHKFEDKGVNCFSEPAFKDIFMSISCNLSDTEGTGMTSDGGTGKNATAASRLRQNFSDNGPVVVPKQSQLANNQVKSSDATQAVSHSLEQKFDKDDPFSNRGRKRELLLDDVVDSSPQGSLQISRGALHSGTKGKRSNREGNPSKDVMSRNGTAKTGRASTSNLKGARRNKTKLKQRATNLSAINDLYKAEEVPKLDFTSTPKSLGVEDRMDDADATELPSHLPDIDACEFDENGQDIGSWLNIDDDGMQDHDFMEGLLIPMDDLSSVLG